MDGRRTWMAIALVSAGMLAFQISLMRVFAYLQGYQFAYLMVSLALLGFGASGTILSLGSNLFERGRAEWIRIAILFASVMMGFSQHLSQLPFLRFDAYLLFNERDQLFRLMAQLAILMLPFLAGAFAIGLYLIGSSDKQGTRYCSTLVGSSVGGLLAIALLDQVEPSRLLAVSGMVSLLGALVLPTGTFNLEPAARTSESSSLQNPSNEKTSFRLSAKSGKSALVALVSGMVLFNVVWPPELISSQFKDRSYFSLLPDARMISEEPDVDGHLEVLHSPSYRYASGLSLSFQGEVEARNVALVNGSVYSHLPSGNPDSSSVFDYSTEKPVFELPVKLENILLLNPHDWEIVDSLSKSGIQSVVVTESHSGVIQYLDSIETRRGIELYHTTARAFLESYAGNRFDLIRFPKAGNIGGSSNLVALQETFEYTVEAYVEAWNQLSDEGLIVTTSSLDHPPRVSLRLLQTYYDVLEAVGIDDSTGHVAALRGWSSISIALSKKPLSAEQLEVFRNACARLQFDPLVLPDLKEEERAQYHELQDSEYFRYVDAIAARDATLDNYVFNIEAATDDRPYVFQFVKLSSLPMLLEAFGGQQTPHLELGLLVLLVTLAIVAGIALVVILAPLVLRNREFRARPSLVVYFLGIGLGYMSFEMSWIHSLNRYLENPAVSAALIISGLLLFSGLGSLVSASLPKSRRIAGLVCGCITCLIALKLPAILLGDWFVEAGMPALRWSLLTGVIGISAFCMGIPFPLGLRVFSRLGKRSLFWAWGLNGFASVISPPLCVLLSMTFSFRWVFGLAALAYLVAGLSLLRAGRQNGSISGVLRL